MYKYIILVRFDAARENNLKKKIMCSGKEISEPRTLNFIYFNKIFKIILKMGFRLEKTVFYCVGSKEFITLLSVRTGIKKSY